MFSNTIILTYCGEDGGGEEDGLYVVPADGEVLRHHVDPVVHCILHHGLIVHQQLVDCLMKISNESQFVVIQPTSL